MSSLKAGTMLYFCYTLNTYLGVQLIVLFQLICFFKNNEYYTPPHYEGPFEKSIYVWMPVCMHVFITNSILWERTSIKFLQTPDTALSKTAYVPGTFLELWIWLWEQKREKSYPHEILNLVGESDHKPVNLLARSFQMVISVKSHLHWVMRGTWVGEWEKRADLDIWARSAQALRLISYAGTSSKSNH